MLLEVYFKDAGKRKVLEISSLDEKTDLHNLDKLQGLAGRKFLTGREDPRACGMLREHLDLHG